MVSSASPISIPELFEFLKCSIVLFGLAIFAFELVSSLSGEILDNKFLVDYYLTLTSG